MTTFLELDLIEPLQRAIADCGYTTPTPIQEQTIPALLERRDLLGCAQTGTGKTAAFALPVLQHLHAEGPTKGQRHIRALVLSPTRELAAQIGASFEEYGQHLSLRHMVIFGGVSERPQVQNLRRGIDTLVACPGRLLDLHGRGLVDLGHVEYLILDEADRMLDMGFIHDIRRIIKVLPKKRQNLLFSATMPAPIAELAGTMLNNPLRVDVAPESTTVERIEQQVMFTAKSDKRKLLVHLLDTLDIECTIVFTRTKHGANRLVKHLTRERYLAAAIHGNKSQNTRERTLSAFRNSEIDILVATDIAARGIDVEQVSHVVNYDLPNVPESYVHRIGRTGRAGRDGVAISFCDDSEGAYLRAIERTIGMSIKPVENHPFHMPEAIPAPLRHQGRRQGSRTSSSPGKGEGARRRRGGRKNSSGGQRNNTSSNTQGDSGSGDNNKTSNTSQRRSRRGGRGRRGSNNNSNNGSGNNSSPSQKQS